MSSCHLSVLLSSLECVSVASYKSRKGVGKKQSVLSFIECSVRWSHCNSIQTAQQSRALTLILINVNTTLILKIQENG